MNPTVEPHSVSLVSDGDRQGQGFPVPVMTYGVSGVGNNISVWIFASPASGELFGSEPSMGRAAGAEAVQYRSDEVSQE